MENAIKSIISILFRMYGADKSIESNIRQERILNLCMNDLASHPTLEKELDTNEKIKYFVVQTILYDVSLNKVHRLL